LWDDDHDDNHMNGELAIVAAFLASPVPLFAVDDRLTDY
jgi:hypothetical protein